MHRFLLLLVLAMAASCGYAQDWYVGINVSRSISTSENMKFSDAYKGLPGGNIVIGDNFNRFLGVRVTGGYNPQQGRVAKKPGVTTSGVDGTYKFTAISCYGDVLFNVTELFRSPGKTHRSSLYLFAGGGAIRVTGFSRHIFMSYWNEDNNSVYTKGGWFPEAHAGLIGDIVLTRKLSLDVEAKYNMISDKWNGISHDNRPFTQTTGSELCYKWDNGFVDFNIGVNWYFNRGKDKHTKAPVTAFEDKSSSKSYERAKAQKPEKEAKPSKEITVNEAQMTYAVGQRMFTGVSFYFDFDYLCVQQKPNIEEVAKYLNANPTVRLNIHAYADKDYTDADGIAHNQKLAAERARAVYGYLTQKCGIAENRLTMLAHASSINGYRQDGEWIRSVEFEIAGK